MKSSDSESVVSRGSSTASRPKIYHCEHENCSKCYSKPSLLEQHRRTHSNDRPFKCTHQGCDKSFFRKSHLDNHLQSHKDDAEKPFHCSVCGKGVNSLQHLKRHEVTHTKSFKCTHEGCSEAFYKHQSLRHHVLSVHEKSLTCQVCNKTFPRPYRLAQHQIKYHGDSPAYQCDHGGCYSNFKTWSALQLHIKTEHPKLKCHICGKGCVGKKGLKSHMISHDEDKMVKLWNCKYCDMGKFSKKLDLIQHYKVYHDDNIPEDLLKVGERQRLEELLSETDNEFSELVTSNLNELQASAASPLGGSSPNSRTGSESRLINLKDDNEDEDDDDDFPYGSDRRSETPRSSKTINALNSSLKRGNTSIIGLISNNYNPYKMSCPKMNCDRTFSREYDLDRHLKWHQNHQKKIETFLDSLDSIPPETTEENPKRRKLDIQVSYPSDYQDDEDLDSLIDDELKSLTAGGSVH